MTNHKKTEETAVQRFQLIAPLLTEGLDAGKAKELKDQICKTSGLSDRTIRRYLSQYRTDGFSGLKPKGKSAATKSEAIPQLLLEQAILLRKEVPSRSVAQIIQILEWESLAEPGQLKRSTLQEKLTENPTLDSRIVEDALRQAVQKYGVPESVYFDNGKQYRTKWMSRTCSKLGTRLIFAKPYAPESKGNAK